MTIERKSGHVALDTIKRCYSDIDIHVKCKKCGNMMEFSLAQDYLSYPEVGEVVKISFYCEKCNAEYDLPVKIISTELTIEYDVDECVQTYGGE